MKTRLLIIIGIIAIFAVSSFYIFIVFNGYSPYNEGIGLTIHDESSKDYHTKPFFSQFQIITLHESDFEKVPKIKAMMDILLDQQFNPQRNGYRVMGSDLTSYWVNTSIDEIRIQTGMPETELNDYKQWHDSKQTFLFRYNDTVFHYSQWVA